MLSTQTTLAFAAFVVSWNFSRVLTPFCLHGAIEPRPSQPFFQSQ